MYNKLRKGPVKIYAKNCLQTPADLKSAGACKQFCA